MKKQFLLLPLLLTVAFRPFAQTPVQVADINPGTASSHPVYLTPFGTRLCFYATDGMHGCELWSHDGTQPPSLVADLQPGSGGAGLLSNPYLQNAVMGGKLYFTASTPATGNELFVYDGTNPPALAADLNPGAASADPRYLTAAGGKLYFIYSEVSTSSELFSYDGIAPVRRYDVFPGGTYSNPRELTEFNGRLYFVARTPTAGVELMELDPATDTFRVVADLRPGTTDASPVCLRVYNGSLYFLARTALNTHELFSYDGTTVRQLTHLSPGINSLGIMTQRIGGYRGDIYFSAAVGSVAKLYRYEPAADTIRPVTTLNHAGSGADDLLGHNGRLYFSAYTAANGSELFEYDSTGNIRCITDLLTPDTMSSSPKHLCESGGSFTSPPMKKS